MQADQMIGAVVQSGLLFIAEVSALEMVLIRSDLNHSNTD
jgi:hypothetical protein